MADTMPKNMANNQKGFANIILVVVIVVFAGVAGYFGFIKKSEPIAYQTPTPTPTQTKITISPTPTPKDETSNWKTYQNTKYGYEFKYPTGIELTTSYGAREGGPATGKDDSVYVGSFLQIEPVNPLGNCSDLRNESAIRTCLGSEPWVQSGTWTPTTIGGQPAVRREVQPNPVGYIWYVNYGKIGFQISGPVSEVSQLPSTEKILSTFKFTK